MVVESLIKDIQETTEHGKLFILFIDFSKTFDSVNRQRLITKLELLMGKSMLTRLVTSIMPENYVQIEDNVTQSGWISQRNGVL